MSLPATCKCPAAHHCGVQPHCRSQTRLEDHDPQEVAEAWLAGNLTGVCNTQRLSPRTRCISHATLHNEHIAQERTGYFAHRTQLMIQWLSCWCSLLDLPLIHPTACMGSGGRVCSAAGRKPKVSCIAYQESRILDTEAMPIHSASWQVGFAFLYLSIEHNGLGRYEYPLDPKGDLHDMEMLSRIIRPGGAKYAHMVLPQIEK